MFSLLISPCSIITHLCPHKYSPRSCRGYLQLPIPFPELKRKSWYCCGLDCKLPPTSDYPRIREHKDQGKHRHYLSAKRWWLDRWLSGSTTAHCFLHLKKNPCSTTVLPIPPMAEECLLLPAFSSTTSISVWCHGTQQVTKTHDLLKMVKACGTAKPDSQMPECNSGASNNLVGFFGGK